MKSLPVLLAGLMSVSLVSLAQNAPARRSITATGQGSVSVTPDLARVDVGVSTTASTAQDAAAQNATQVSSVLAQLKLALGTTGEVKTVSYSLTPNYNYPPNGTPVLTGYTATNIVEATTSDLTIVGKVIDSAVQGGANRVQSLTFTLKDDSAARGQALQSAAKRARADADAIATGLGIHTGNIIQANEGTTVTPVISLGAATPTAAATPVQPGNLEVHATVTIQVEIVP